VVGLAHGAHAVCGSWAAAGEHDAGLAGDAGVAVGHEAEGVFVAAADEADGVLLMVEGVVDVHGVGGDDAEDGVDVVGLEAFDNGFAAGHDGHGRLLRVKDGVIIEESWGVGEGESGLQEDGFDAGERLFV